MIKDLKEILSHTFDDWGNDQDISGNTALPQMQLRLCGAIDNWFVETKEIFNGKSTKKLYSYTESLKRTSKNFVAMCHEALQFNTLYRVTIDNFIIDLLEVAHEVTQYANDTLTSAKYEQTIETPLYQSPKSWIRRTQMVGVFSAN